MRRLQEADYPAIISKIDEWWGGRTMTALLPRLFFQHFADRAGIKIVRKIPRVFWEDGFCVQ